MDLGMNLETVFSEIAAFLGRQLVVLQGFCTAIAVQFGDRDGKSVASQPGKRSSWATPVNNTWSFSLEYHPPPFRNSLFSGYSGI
jgi:hypothetical protein